MTLMRRAGLIVTALSLLFSAAPSYAVHAASIQRTRVTTYVPVIPGGTVRSGSCWTRSIAAPSRSDAYRCMLENSIYDPCFSARSRRGFVVCDLNPAGGGLGFALRLTKALPVESTFGAPSPWLVQLTGGDVCIPLTGTHELIGKESIGFECSGPKKTGNAFGLIDGSFTRGAVWRARLAQYQINRSGPLTGTVTVVPLAAVWL